DILPLPPHLSLSLTLSLSLHFLASVHLLLPEPREVFLLASDLRLGLVVAWLGAKSIGGGGVGGRVGVSSGPCSHSRCQGPREISPSTYFPWQPPLTSPR